IPTADTTARTKSGCCVNIAPISRPPLLPPRIASLSGRVHFSLIKYCAAAADIRDYPNAAAIEPEPPGKIKARLHADAVPAVTVKQRRVIPIEFRSLFANDVQWNVRAIL